MSRIVTMSTTVGPLVSGQTYRVRTREAEALVAASQATLVNKRGPNSGVPPSNEGKSRK